MTGGWLIHGVIETAAPPPSDAPPHERLDAGGLVALLTPAGDLDPEGTTPPAILEAALRRHDSLLSAYVREADVLPLRFGSLLADRHAAAELLRARAEDFVAGLSAIAGRQEYLLRIGEASGQVRAPAPSAHSGRDYLRGLSALRRGDGLRQERIRALILQIRAAMAHVAAGQVLGPVPGPVGEAGAARLTLSALVPRGSAAALTDRLAEAGREAAPLGLTLALSGPWPAYSFVAPGESAGAIS